MHSTTPVGISGVMKRLQSHCGCPAPLTTPHSRDQVWCACSNCLVALRSVRSALAPRLLSVVSSLAHANEAAALFLLLGVEIEGKKNPRIGGRGSERVTESREGVCGAARRLQNSRKPLRAQRNSRNFAQQQWRHRVATYLRAFLVWPATRLRSAVALRRALRGLTPCIQHALHCEPEAISAPHERAKKSKNPVQFTT